MKETDKAFYGTVFNLLNYLMGSGVLPIAYAFRCTGVVLGVLILFSIALFNQFTTTLLYLAMKASGCLSYEDLVYHTMGNRARFVLRLTMVILLFGTLCGGMVQISELCWMFMVFTGAFPDPGRYNLGADNPPQALSLLIVSAVLIFPLSSLRRMDSLAWSSFFGLLLLLFITGCVVALSIISGFSGTVLHYPSSLDYLVRWDRDVLLAVPIFGFCFFIQPAVFPICVELGHVSHDGNPAKMTIFPRALNTALVIGAVVYSTIGSFGYLQYGSHTEDNLFMNYDASSWLTAILNLLTFLYLAVCYPLTYFTMRVCIEDLCFGDQSESTLQSIPTEVDPNPKFESMNDVEAEPLVAARFTPPAATHSARFLLVRHLCMTFVLVFATCAVAILYPHISDILGLIGATTVLDVCYVFPVVAYVRLRLGWCRADRPVGHPEGFADSDGDHLAPKRRSVAWLLRNDWRFSVSVLVMLAGTAVSIVSLVVLVDEITGRDI